MSEMKEPVTLHIGDCLEVMAGLAACSVDSVVTDPPYHLTSIVKRFGAEGAAAAQFGSDGAYMRASRGFMGKQWDGGDIAFRPELWAAVLRVVKPGGHVLAFGGTRTYHRMVCAIEDAGFEIRDSIMWLYGSGFPKSHSVSKAIDRAAGAERGTAYKPNNGNNVYGNGMGGGEWNAPSHPAITDAAKRWDGWGTALKPACELIVLARKPLSEKSVAANVLEHGTGAINVDGCRVAGIKPQVTQGINGSATSFNVARECRISGDPNEGRWPANVIHDGSEEVVGRFPGDPGGSAARFFYTAKADADDRIASKHPTVKPVDLIQYLVRLVTPKGGLVLDPFAGTGTTGEACIYEGMRAILIERELEYREDILRRLELTKSGPDEKARLIMKEKMKNKPIDPGPLFAADKYDPVDDFAKSIDECYSDIRKRMADGGPGWEPSQGE